MGGAPNHRAFCPQTSRFAFLDREEGCHQLCGFRFLARKCKNRPLPPGGRRGQSRQKTEMKTSPPQGLCGIDRWLPPHSAPPLRPLNVGGARPPPGPPGREQNFVFLRGPSHLMPTSSDKGVPSEEARKSSKPPRRRRREPGCSAEDTQLPRALAEETPPARRPAPTDLAELLALGELLEGIALGTLGAGVQGRGRHPAPPPPPPAPRRGPTGNSGAAAAAAARAAGSSSSPLPCLAPTRASPRRPEALQSVPSPSASTSAPSPLSDAVQAAPA